MTEEEFREIATALHDAECQVSHSDECAWLYELNDFDPWKGFAHQRWLRRATTGEFVFRGRAA